MPATNNIPRRVLLIEDDQEKANSFTALLGTAGYEVETAFDGESAKEAAEHFNPDVCLVDLTVPQLDMDELARHVRENLQHPPLLANVTPFMDRDEDNDVEFDLDFTKPSDVVEVVVQLSDCLRNDLPKMGAKVYKQSEMRAPRMPNFRK